MESILILNKKRIKTVFLDGLCCPELTNATLESQDCCMCSYSLDLIGFTPPGCGDSTYFPNACEEIQNFTNEAEIGPFLFDCFVVVGDGGIEVDDDLQIDGVTFEEGEHLVELGAGETGRSVGVECEEFGGGLSQCNGAHAIEPGTILAILQAGESITIRGKDNHGIDLYLRGDINVIPA